MSKGKSMRICPSAKRDRELLPPPRHGGASAKGLTGQLAGGGKRTPREHQGRGAEVFWRAFGETGAVTPGRGTRLVVETRPEGVLLKPESVFAETRTEDVYGCLAYDGPAKLVTDIQAGFLAAARRRHAGD